MLTALVMIRCGRDQVASLGPGLAEVEGVSEVYSVTGDWDFVAVVRVRRHEELAQVVTERMVRLEGITATRTMVAFRQYSRHDLESMFDLGEEAWRP